MTFAESAAAAFRSGQQLRGDAATANAEEAYDAAVEMVKDIPADERKVVQPYLELLRFTIDLLPVTQY
jgi:hypothetical protein